MCRDDVFGDWKYFYRNNHSSHATTPAEPRFYKKPSTSFQWSTPTQWKFVFRGKLSVGMFIIKFEIRVGNCMACCLWCIPRRLLTWREHPRAGQHIVYRRVKRMSHCIIYDPLHTLKNINSFVWVGNNGVTSRWMTSTELIEQKKFFSISIISLVPDENFTRWPDQIFTRCFGGRAK